MVWSPCLIRYQDRAGAVSVVLGQPLVDDYLEFVAARSRTNTLLATAYDLKVFFGSGQDPRDDRVHKRIRDARCTTRDSRHSRSREQSQPVDRRITLVHVIPWLSAGCLGG
jgi:hypothetical protein